MPDSWTQSAEQEPNQLREGIAMLLEELSQWQEGEKPQDDISILAVEVTTAANRHGPVRQSHAPADAVPANC